MTANPLPPLTVLFVLVPRLQLALPTPILVLFWLVCVLAIVVALRPERKH
jgi:hypothetical protein